MSKTINLRTALTSELKKTIDKVFYEDATNTTPYPYIVYSLEGVGDNYQLEINVYDKGSSTVELEKITDNIVSYFRNYIYRDENQIFTVEFNTRNNVEEDDKSIKRRLIIFDIYYSWREM